MKRRKPGPLPAGYRGATAPARFQRGGRLPRSIILPLSLAALALLLVLAGLQIWHGAAVNRDRLNDQLAFAVAETAQTADVLLRARFDALDQARVAAATGGPATLSLFACPADRPTPRCLAGLTLGEPATGGATGRRDGGIDCGQAALLAERVAPGGRAVGPVRRTADGRLLAALAIGAGAGGPALGYCADVGAILDGWRSLDWPDGSAVALVTTGGRLWLRHPFDPGQLGLDVADGPLVTAIRDAGTPTGRGVPIVAVRTDGIPRVVSWQTLEAPRLILVAGMPTALYLQTWRAQHGLAAALTAALVLAVIGLFVAGLRLAARRDREVHGLAQRLSLAAAAGRIGVWHYDFATDRLDWNEQMFALHGRDPARFSGSFADWQACVHPEDLPDVAAAFMEARRSRRHFDHVFRVVHEDGTVRWINAHAEFQDVDDGLPRQATGVNLDVTEDMERQRRVGDELARALDANAAKTRFLAGLSHELRTPMNAILGFSDMLRGPLADRLAPEKKREYLDDIHASGTHLLALINDLLDISRIDNEQVDLEPETIDLASFLDAVDRMVEQAATTRPPALALDLPDGLPPVVADRRALQQIVINLVSNAIKFTPSTGRITIRARAEGATVALGVADTGHGIPADRIERLGRPFERVRDGWTASREGLGLGLSIARRLAELMGGSLTIESALGRGTCVTVALPVAGTAATDAALPGDPQPAPAGRAAGRRSSAA